MSCSGTFAEPFDEFKELNASDKLCSYALMTYSRAPSTAERAKYL